MLLLTHSDEHPFEEHVLRPNTLNTHDIWLVPHGEVADVPRRLGVGG
jgi:hypothetical protein